MTSRFDPPPHYDAERRTIWAEVTDQLTAGGRIFQTDPRVLDTYVQAACTHNQVTRVLAESSVAITREGPRGRREVIANPLLAIQRDTAKALTQASKALGLDRVPMAPAQPSAPISDPEPPGRWCETHQRRECIHNRAHGGLCHARPPKGTESCQKHAGKTLDALKADGARYLARLAPPIEVSPSQGLLEEVYRSAGMVAWLEAECAAIPPEELWRGVTKTVDRDGALETVTETRPHVKLMALNRERDHFASVCDRALARGAEQQMVDVAKVTGAMIGRLMDAVFARLELSEWQRSQLPVVVPAVVREFGQITTGSA